MNMKVIEGKYVIDIKIRKLLKKRLKKAAERIKSLQVIPTQLRISGWN